MKKTMRCIAVLMVLSAMLAIVSCGGGSSSGSDGVTLAVNHYYQCDLNWKNDTMGASSSTICATGTLLSSLAMMMSTADPSVAPDTLNTWLTANSGYLANTTLIFLNRISLHNTAPFDYLGEGAYALTTFKAQLDAGVAVPVNVQNGTHFVLVFGYENGGVTEADFLYYDPADSTATAYDFDTVSTPTDMYLYE